jgi:hypothetical protein
MLADGDAVVGAGLEFPVGVVVPAHGAGGGAGGGGESAGGLPADRVVVVGGDDVPRVGRRFRPAVVEAV